MKRAQGLRREIAGFQEQEGIVAGTPLAYPAKMTRPCSTWDLGWDEANFPPTMGLSSGLPEADAGATPSRADVIAAQRSLALRWWWWWC